MSTSIPRLEPSGLPQELQGSDFSQTDLIARWANEFFAHAPASAATPPAPALPTTGFEHVPAATLPTAPGAPVTPLDISPAADADHRDIALSGGFPAAAAPSAPPPVHPTVVAAEPVALSPVEDPPSGAHREDSADSHEFGEPSFYAQSFPTGVAPSSVRPRSAPAFAAPAFPDLGAVPSGSDFYFLEHLTSAGSPPASWPLSAGAPAFDVEGVRADFPALRQQIHGHPLIWLDNAATTHKPQSVIDATSRFYSRDNSNIHRAAHTLAARSTGHFESGREKVRRFLGAARVEEIVFLRGTTEAINLVAQSWGRQHVGAGDEIIVSQLEHHANIVPWQILAGQTGATLRVIPINDRGELLLEELPKLFNDRTKIVAVTQVSNALGTVNPVAEIIRLAHARGVPVLVDGAQSTPHLPIDVQALDADFFVFSGHKIFGPTGIGVLYGKHALLESMPPWQGGGHMIRDVTFERTLYNHAPEKFEAGTPDIAGVVGLSAALDYLDALGLPAIAAYEHALLEYAEEALRSVRGVRAIGTAADKASVFGFVVPGLANDRIARALDRQGIAVRAGHHCAQPAVRHFGVEGTIRPSLAFYNTRAEVDAFIQALHGIVRG